MGGGGEGIGGQSQNDGTWLHTLSRLSLFQRNKARSATCVQEHTTTSKIQDGQTQRRLREVAMRRGTTTIFF